MLKRIMFCLALMLIASSVFAGWPTGAPPLVVRIPCFNTRWIVSFTGVYENFYTPELDYATRYPFLFVEGRTINDDSDYDWGFAGTLGYIFPCSANDVQVSYAYFDSEEVDHSRARTEIVIPNLTTAINTVDVSDQFGPGRTFAPVPGSPIVISPTGVITIPLNLINGRAVSKFRTTITDINFGQYIDIDEILRIRIFAGARYSYIKHNFDASYHFFNTQSGLIQVINPPPTPAEFPVADVTSTINQLFTQRSIFTGLGPRIGFNSNLFLGNGFGLFGSLSAALLIGDSTSKLFLVSDITNTAVLEFIPPSGSTNRIFVVSTAALQPQPRIVPNLYSEVGVDYTFIWASTVQSTVTLSAGYQMDHYFNAVDRLSSPNALLPQFRTRHPMDVDFAGFFVRLEARI